MFNLFSIDFIILFMFIVGVLTFCLLQSHLLLCLLSLEYIVLCLFISMFMFFSSWGNGECFVIFYLSFSVCEGVLGLALMVSMIRCHGNDNLMSLSLLGC